ncbi:hypothetical protein EIP91_003676 [Steccherinum ochraceum]|uniref:CxC5 like cysteine cluster associated with KDZ domain-containing protein n=1 Tax=Steccherinum ochraceum TaxID=92696 RepID=A0A4R0RA17_9APHY|nr:hypothetical protein EIP91_003676 [Steccherinum ochraceum]
MSYSSACSNCHATYYPAYWVHGSGGIRTHYLGIPPAIQIATHAYMETSLCNRFTNSTVCAWVSSTNNAHIYNLEHEARREAFPGEDIWKAIIPELTTALVWDAFFIYALLRHFDEQQDYLSNAQGILLALGDRFGAISARSVVISEDRTKAAQLSEKMATGPVLRSRLERLRMASLHEADTSTEDEQPPQGEELTEEQVAVEEDGECPDKPEEGNPAAQAAALASGKPRALFGRKRTHNEQLIVNACGIIAGRVTMFGSEAVDGARVALVGTYPTPRSVPQVVFYDNACRFKAHLEGPGMSDEQRKHFKYCAMPVDAFHMKTKHKITDQFCQANCNPVLFEDLIVGFQAMVREMRADRYDFFLDEMIKLRNRMTVDDLDKKGADCREIPARLLLYPDDE